jgi:Ca2+-binding RTX toxin-like protein
MGGGADDGASGERDDVRADVEQVAGGHGDDTLTGDDGDNRLSGNAGNDRLTGGRGHDELIGGAGDDSLDGRDWWHYSGAVTDRISCGEGLDTVLHDSIDWLSPTCENR